jgi:tetratricopeptide (TPR) repeat protein
VLSASTQLVDLLLFRVQFLGTVADFDEAEAVATAAVRAHRNTATAYRLRARVYSALHRFEDALDDLRQAEALGADTDALHQQRETVYLAQGHFLPQVFKTRQRAFHERPSYTTAIRAAIAAGQVGAFHEADQLYAQATELYRDASPFSIAWVAFQRGVLWAEQAGRPDKAFTYYREAVRLLPGYVGANVHLAELLASAGKTKKALNRLLRFDAVNPHPEVAAALANLLENIGRKEEAARYAQQAHMRYGQLLSHHRAAFLDHAAEFYYRSGKSPALALHLAIENLQHRQTDRAYEIALLAANAADDIAQLCRLSQAVVSHQPKHVPVIHLMEQAQLRCPITGS